MALVHFYIIITFLRRIKDNNAYKLGDKPIIAPTKRWLNMIVKRKSTLLERVPTTVASRKLADSRKYI